MGFENPGVGFDKFLKTQGWAFTKPMGGFSKSTGGFWKSRGGFQNPWVVFDFLNKLLKKIAPKNQDMDLTFFEKPRGGF